MSQSRLALVSDAAADPMVETRAQRVRRLQQEAHALAREEVGTLEESMMALAALADEIATGGDAYPVGAREIARRIAEELPLRAQTLEAIVSRS